jgi:hypothetical protein
MRNHTKMMRATGNLMIAAAIGVALSGFYSTARAEQLPKTGTINFHTGWKYAADVVNATDKHVVGRGSVTGVTFNDKGSGPLHLGPANCFEAFFIVEGKGRDKGFCAFGDPDGDRIFTDFSGTFGPDGASGTNEIVGGTGKYAGIQGSGPWKCKGVGNNGENQCTQRLDYRLP